MPHRRTISWVAIALGVAALACSVPPEVLDAINRLPTPTSTATPAPSAILYVDKAGSDDNDCTTAATACLTIMAALDKAAEGAAIYIGPGIYAENDVRSLDGALVIYDQEVSLYGAATPAGITTVITGSGGLDTVIVMGDSHVVMENVALVDAGAQGFGLYVTGAAGANVTLRNSEIRNSLRAAVRIPHAATVLLETVRLVDNPLQAIDNYGSLTLRRGRVSRNGAGVIDDGRIGLIYNRGTMRIIESTLANNDSTAGFVLMNAEDGAMTLESSTVNGNRVSAAYNAPGANLTMTNSTLSGNLAGIQNLGDLNLISSTVAGNEGSGMFSNSGLIPPHVRLENSLIVNNGAQDCYYQLGHSITFDRRGRNLSDGSCDHEYGGYFFRPPEGDAFLGPLADNGGPTRTRALLEGSLAIDAAEGPCLATDQRGIARPVGGGCDVGAYEFNFAVTAATPAATLIAVQTEIATPSATPPATEPQVTLLQKANCRKGPGIGYDVLTSFEKGIQTTVVGRNEPSTWWLVKVPATTVECWVAGSTVETQGDASGLSVVPVPPVPVAPTGLDLSQSTCSPNLNHYAVELGWSDGSGETGYRLYRNGTLVITLGANATSHSDQAPKGTALTYELEAFNALGRAERVALGVPACK